MEKTISLNQEEAQVLLNLLNIANKAIGLEAAEACLHFSKKLTVILTEFKDAEPKKDTRTTAIEDAEVVESN